MNRPPDEKARKEIVDRLDVSMIVEAGAGSGKTASLVQRILSLVGAGKCAADTMAAITFTRKAASELKGRFQNALEKAIRAETEPLRLERLRDALTNLDLLFCGTVHSFCAHILKERPVEAGLDPDFTELEEDENAVLRDRCWTEHLENLHLGSAPILEELRVLGIDADDLRETYQSVCLYPEVDIVRAKLERPDFEPEKRLLIRYLEEAGKQISTKVPEKGWDSLQTILRKSRQRLRHLDIGEDRNFIKVLSGLKNRSAMVTQYKWPSPAIAKEQLELFKSFRDTTVLPSLQRWKEYCHYFVMELVVSAVKYFDSQRSKNSLMNYQDLLLKTAVLLREKSEVRGYFQRRFTHVLVDEFQDTDPIQAEVITFLCGDGVNERSWHKLMIRPGSLFIVGDPKQSIYRFRRADIDIYNTVKDKIRASGGAVVSLTTNFRSLPAICDWANPIFKSKFPVLGTQFQPPFEELVPFKDVKAGTVKKVTIGAKTVEEAAREDAERIASWISWALKGNFRLVAEEEKADGEYRMTRPGDFMILLRYRKNLSHYARALEARNIPYEISGGGAFNQSEEFGHLLTLLKSVAEPDDRLALVATLRGPFFGLSDDVLYRFKRTGGVFSYSRPEFRCDDKEAMETVGAALAELGRFHSWARTKPPAGAFSMILDATGIVPLSFARELGQSRSGNLLKAVEIAFQGAGCQACSFPELVGHLSRYYEEVDVDEMSVEPGKKDAVRIMNLHKAKGLEAPVVFLADPLKDVNHPPEFHIKRSKDVVEGIFVATTKPSDYRTEVIALPPDWETYEEIEEKYEAAENDRLLYVAATRAKQMLVVSCPGSSSKGAWKGLYPYLNDLHELERVEDKFSAAEVGEINPEDFASGKEETAKRMDMLRKPGYRLETVTRLAEEASETKPFDNSAGKGMNWGRVIHGMLDALARNESKDINILAEMFLWEQGFALSEKDAAIACVGDVMRSELWNRLKKAANVMTEVPFSISSNEDGVPAVISGVIDLAFEEPDGWVIADYKTDKVDGSLDKFIAYYRPQIQMYRKFFEEISGEKIKEAGIYFVGGGNWIPVI